MSSVVYIPLFVYVDLPPDLIYMILFIINIIYYYNVVYYIIHKYALMICSGHGYKYVSAVPVRLQITAAGLCGDRS